MKKFLILLVVALSLTGCFKSTENSDEEEINKVVGGKKGDYSIITPFTTSAIRQTYVHGYREIDTLEIGKRLQEKSKEYFSPSSYFISEGSVINEEHYKQLVNAKSENYKYGLNAERGTEFNETVKSGNTTKTVTIKNPRFVHSLYEVNFYKDKNREKLEGMSVTVVLDRKQFVDRDVNDEIISVSDESLFKIANDMISVQLNAYLRSIEEVKNIPVMIAFYVTDSVDDNIAGNYLPGYYIGHGYYESGRETSSLVRDTERHYLLNTTLASKDIPQAHGNFSVFNRKIMDFIEDETVGVIGTAFTINKEVQNYKIQVTTASKTELELYGITQYIMSQIQTLDNNRVPIVVDIKVYEDTKAMINVNNNGEVSVTYSY